MEISGITLKNLLESVKREISSSFPHPYWVKAEIRALTAKPGWHCYLDLADKDEEGTVSAQARGIIWASQWRVLEPYFSKHAGKTLEPGMEILVHATVQFTELYGFSLIIDDIDPAYTAGEIELKRQMTIAKLKEEGMMEMNTLIPLPRLPRRFAVISASGAAGYGDFMNHLHHNEYGFTFHTDLYEAPMQGVTAPSGIVAALDRVLEKRESYDAVLLLRGGGSVADLSCFDDYGLCAAIAQFPLPVMCAVGHDRDTHIADMVARVTVKTPTALADYIVTIFADEDAMLLSYANRLALAVGNKTHALAAHLDAMTEKISVLVRSRLAAEKTRLDMVEERVEKSNPFSLMHSGYSLVFRSGRRVLSVAGMKTGDDVEVMFGDGTALCSVKEIKHN